MASNTPIRVWDLPTRIFHWATVLLFVLAFASDDWMAFHAVAGYGLMALVFFRLIWGLIGNRYAKFSEFIKSWPTVRDYTKSLMTFKPPHSIGHNPLGGWVILMLLFAVFMSVFTGMFAEDDGFYGPLYYSAAFSDFVKSAMGNIHEGMTSVLLGLVLIHVAGVVADWMMTGDNLIRAMITGNKESKVVTKDKDIDPESLSAPPQKMASLINATVALILSIGAVWIIIR